MGDRCYVRMTLKDEDLVRFGKYLGVKPGERWWDEQDEPGDGLIGVGIFEANDGLTDQRGEAAKAGIPFFGWHGEGGEYGGAEFASLGGEMLECETNRDGELVLVLDDDLNVQSDLEHIRRYVAMRRQVQAQFGIKPLDEDAAPGVSDLVYVMDGGLKCPYCQSHHVEADCAPVVEIREAWQDVTCTDCGRVWRDRYALEGYEDLPAEVRRAA